MVESEASSEDLTSGMTLRDKEWADGGPVLLVPWMECLEQPSVEGCRLWQAAHQFLEGFAEVVILPWSDVVAK